MSNRRFLGHFHHSKCLIGLFLKRTLTSNLCDYWSIGQNEVFRIFRSISASYIVEKEKAASEKTHLSPCVGILGLEPRMTGPESVVLPLHHIPMKERIAECSDLRVQR